MGDPLVYGSERGKNNFSWLLSNARAAMDQANVVPRSLR